MVLPPREPLRYNDPVSEPKDASGIEACDLLTDDQVLELGLVADSAEQVDLRARIQSCVWSSAIYPASPVSIQKNIDTGVPVLDGLDLISDGVLLYEDVEVAGHPGKRGELSDSGTCTIMVAASDYQGIAAKTVQPEPDPCSTPLRMVEFVLVNLPPLIEE